MDEVTPVGDMHVTYWSVRTLKSTRDVTGPLHPIASCSRRWLTLSIATAMYSLPGSISSLTLDHSVVLIYLLCG